MGSPDYDYNADLQYIDADEEARQRRVKISIAAVIGVVVVAALLWLGGAFAAGPEAAATHYLDVVLTVGKSDKHFNTRDVPGHEAVTGKVVRGYEVKNVVGNVVAVDVTFESQAGTDLHKTLRFTVEGGEVVRIE